MKALQLDSDKKMEVVETEKPLIGSGQVLVKIMAAALNHREIWITKGLYPGMKLPCILGADGSGVVAEVGEGVPDIVGEEIIIYPAYDWGDNPQKPLKKFRVLGMPEPGTIAEYIAVPQENIFKKPAYLSFEEASAIPVASLTAWRALKTHGDVKMGENILITGIGGGVAQAGLELAKAMGANIYVTSSSKEKVDGAIDDGAKGGVLYTDEDWYLQLKELSGGIDMVLDSSPSPNLDDYLKFLNIGARIVAYGSTGSRKTTLNISKFFLRHIHFIGTAMGSPFEFGELLDFMSDHHIKPRIHKSYSLSNAIEAIHDLEKGRQTGKIVVKIADS